MARLARISASLAVLALAAVGTAVEARPAGGGAPASFVAAPWKPGEAYGVVIEHSPLGQPVRNREFSLIHAIKSDHKAHPDLLVITHDAGTGFLTSAYRVSLDDAGGQLRSAEPLALRFEAKDGAFAIKSDGAPIPCRAQAAASAFCMARVPTSLGGAWLPFWRAGSAGETARTDVDGTWVDTCGAEPVYRTLHQTSRTDAWGALIVDVRTDGGGAPLMGSARFEPHLPMPAYGEIVDSERRESLRFRVVFHTDNLPQSLILSRGQVAGDPMLFPPELLLDAESEWQGGVHDLVAEEVLTSLKAERRWRSVRPRESPAVGEIVGYGYELFAAHGAVKTGESAQSAPAAPPKSKISPRGAVGAVFAGRLEAAENGLKYEAWILPGNDERAEETDAPNPTLESTGRLHLRWVLGRAGGGYFGDRPLGFFRPQSAHGFAAKVSAPGNEKNAYPKGLVHASTRRGSDALLIRRESDLAPVLLVFYRLANDLRSVVVFAKIDLDGNGSLSAVRRSLLERPKDFFVSGGFTSFSSKRGAGILITRTDDEGTTVEPLTARTCSVHLLSEKELPEEPWKIPFELGKNAAPLWGTPAAFAVGRNHYGDARAPRAGIMRRTDDEEMVAYEYWEPESPWWSAAIAVYPKQQLGTRFRPLVHTPAEKIVDNDADPGEVVPFDPPPPPPQPQGNPRTQPEKPRPAKPPKKPSKPAKENPTPPTPTPGTGPKTGGGGQ